jgi:two-component system phosphate regulon response regulator PhoB
MLNILVIEDESAILDMLTDVLEEAGFFVQKALDTQRALVLMGRNMPDLILLDWMLPGQSGIEWATRLKKDKTYGDIPIIMLTARGGEDDKIKSLDTGVDDHITKPFSPRELVARIRAVLRRSGKLGRLEPINIGGITLAPDQHRVSIKNNPVNVSPTEYRLLEFFMTHPDRVYSRSQLLDKVWTQDTFIEERTVDVHIRRLRKVLSDYGRDDLIQTVRGFGYRFSVN